MKQIGLDFSAPELPPAPHISKPAPAAPKISKPISAAPKAPTLTPKPTAPPSRSKVASASVASWHDGEVQPNADWTDEAEMKQWLDANIPGAKVIKTWRVEKIRCTVLIPKK